ncbi:MULTISPECIES: glycoside hydrolase family 18 protein [unclassified Bacillus (in: firmicutes)]|uniref:glycoside hydrolase family 18 protein n=1 Tax=unclassified Bacillus (in: firmicutes) TaxID=185979 RepID=UPI0008E368CD|nr:MULTISPECIES: glycoside hydrolase family 18 protein [unclassified Bacillus (in: firmicutes)]SFA89709.1 Chitinase, GH18 family [Bacillus sp. UNCCL13]SFQ85006.1 Chitinase, GH18 family [Bacillus sp. cl95]
MRKRNVLRVLVIIVTFFGGFLSGMFYIEGKQKNTSIQTQPNPHSSKKQYEKLVPKWTEPIDNVLIGYVQDFRDPAQVDYNHLSHIIFSFAHPLKDGSIKLNGDLAIKNLRAIVANAHKNDKKAILAVGGWFHIDGGESYGYFKEAMSNPTSRTKLANELYTIAERENLDGIDIDFEHPHSKADAQNLAAFTKELSNKLHPKGKELSIAVYAKIHAVTLSESGFVVYEPSMFNDVDHVNIMAYDGQWDDGYNASNLSPYPFTEKVVKYWATYFDEHKLSKEKLVLGVPFYGQPENPKIKQVSFAAIVNKGEENASRDTVVMNGTTYHYNGRVTMQKKTNLALENGFGGMMLWEAGHDATGKHSLTAAISNFITEANEQKRLSVKK